MATATDSMTATFDPSQFAAAVGHVWQQARNRGLGTAFPTDWFLQDIRE
jgi:hypothetical protein